MPFRLAAALAALCLSANAPAASYTRVVPEASSVAFEYRQMGVAMAGHFKRFNATLAFDPAKPVAAKVAFDIELASIDAGSPEADGEAAAPAWFNFRQFPRARFVSRSVRALGHGRYQLVGVLTLKGKSREIALPVSFKPAGNAASFDGSFVLKRLDFGVGDGPWADPDTVANEVRVRVRLTATGQ